MIDRVEDVLANFHVAFTAARQLVIERMRQPRQLRLRNEMVCSATHVANRSVVEIGPHAATYVQAGRLLEEREAVYSTFLQLIPLGITIRGLRLRLRALAPSFATNIM